MLFTVDLILHEEMALLFQVGAAVSARVTVRVAMMVPQLHEHANNTSATSVTHGQLLGISNQCSHFGDQSLNTSESQGLVGIPFLLREFPAKPGTKWTVSEAHLTPVSPGASCKL